MKRWVEISRLTADRDGWRAQVDQVDKLFPFKPDVKKALLALAGTGIKSGASLL